MFVSSIGFYLCVKKLQVFGVDKRIYTLANYLFPSVIFFLLAIIYNQSIWLTLIIIVSIFIARVILNYVGTIAGYKGMELAPNAGYSLVIQKSYAIYTLFASALLFGSELSPRKIIIAFFVLGCGLLVAVERGKRFNVNNYKWSLLSILAFFCFGTIALSSKYFANLGVKPITQLFWTSLLTLFLTGIDVGRLKGRISFRPTHEIYLYLILLGFSVTAFYYFKLTAEVAAPNLGYVGTINAASNAVYTVIVAIIFKDHLSWKKFIAVAGITFGLVLLLFT